MRIADMLSRPKPSVSFEFMAPRDESEVEVLERTVATLAGHAPDWVSVTYRLRTGEKTLELVTRIKRHYHIEAMAHLTCANSAARTRQMLNWMEREGIANVLALRGDTQTPGQPFAPADPELTHGSDLVGFVRRNGYRFGIGAACSTEKHPESPDLEHELRYMNPKEEAGGGVGVGDCIAECAGLLEAGVPGLHFYTFNRARGPIEILAALRGQQLLAS